MLHHCKLFCSEQSIVWLVSYIVNEVLLLYPSSSYLLLNGSHNLSAVNYTNIHVLAPK
jgi:hypothetical protein